MVKKKELQAPLNSSFFATHWRRKSTEFDPLKNFFKKIKHS